VHQALSGCSTYLILGRDLTLLLLQLYILLDDTLQRYTWLQQISTAGVQRHKPAQICTITLLAWSITYLQLLFEDMLD
jgi:hypothetical protein